MSWYQRTCCVFMFARLHRNTTTMSTWMHRFIRMCTNTCLREPEVRWSMCRNVWSWCKMWSYQPLTDMQLQFRWNGWPIPKLPTNSTTSANRKRRSMFIKSMPRFMQSLRSEQSMQSIWRDAVVSMHQWIHWFTAKLSPRMCTQCWLSDSIGLYK